MNLHDILKTGYSNNRTKQEEFGKKHGYQLDKELTNKNHQVYVNPAENKVLYNINGTQGNQGLGKLITDWNTNVQIAIGKGKKTQRYEEEKGNLEKAKKKYENYNTTLTGHSQAHYFINELGDKKDKKITYNGAHFPFQPVKTTHYKTTLDPVSVFATNAKNTKILSSNFKGDFVPDSRTLRVLTPSLPIGSPLVYFANEAVKAHSLDKIKNKKIIV
jgi:hypothetical protein